MHPYTATVFRYSPQVYRESSLQSAMRWLTRNFHEAEKFPFICGENNCLRIYSQQSNIDTQTYAESAKARHYSVSRSRKYFVFYPSMTEMEGISCTAECFICNENPDSLHKELTNWIRQNRRQCWVVGKRCAHGGVQKEIKKPAILACGGFVVLHALSSRSDQSTHCLAFRNIRSHGDSLFHSPGCQLRLTLRSVRSGCGMRMVARPSSLVSPVMPSLEPLGLDG